MPIKLLPLQLINQIAAGEIIERPASVVKELLENAIDAQSNMIKITIENGGKTLIQVQDDGQGIMVEELPLALARHATSKIVSMEDLNQINTLGFRGEALPSIASVSHLTLISRCQTQDIAWKLPVSAKPTLESAIPISHPMGTTVDVQDLFYNLPVRRKFLRSDKIELTHIDTLVKKMALSHAEIGFSFNTAQKNLWKYPSAQPLLQRVAMILGDDFIEQAIAIDYESSDFYLSGWVLPATAKTERRDKQYFYLNQRFVRDRLISKACRETLGNVASYVLYLQASPRLFDINVHPSKQEVRFKQAQQCYQFLFTAIQSHLPKPLPSVAKKSLDFGIETSTKPATVAEQMAFYQTHTDTHTDLDFDSKTKQQLILYQGFVLRQQQQQLFLLDIQQAYQQKIYGQLQQQWQSNFKLLTQTLTAPKSVTVTEQQADWVEQQAHELLDYGFLIESLGFDKVVVREQPQLLEKLTLDLPQFIPILCHWFMSEEQESDILANLANYYQRYCPKNEIEIAQFISELETLTLAENGWKNISPEQLKAFYQELCQVSIL